jgi:hypothetical protein
MNIVKYAFIICLFLVSHGLLAQTAVTVERTDTLYYIFMFPVNSYTIEPEWRGNVKEIRQIDAISHSYQDKDYTITSMDIATFASFEGGGQMRDALLERRAVVVKDFLLERFRFSEQTLVNIEKPGMDWESLHHIVLQEEAISLGEKTPLLEIINDNGLNDEEKEARIIQLNGRTTFDHLIQYAPDLFRRADVQIIIRYKEKIIEPQSVPLLCLKTNLAFWGAGVANAGVEFPIGRQLSVDIPIIYSPYTIANDWRIRMLGIQPEVRWWTEQAMKGHFIGMHSHLAYYNISTNQLNRYQDRDRKTPLWGFGMSYGYALPLHKRWNMEFTIGGGYARLDYDVFYNVNNGAVSDSGTKNYWGMTRAAINLIYQFNIK